MVKGFCTISYGEDLKDLEMYNKIWEVGRNGEINAPFEHLDEGIGVNQFCYACPKGPSYK